MFQQSHTSPGCPSSRGKGATFATAGVCPADQTRLRRGALVSPRNSRNLAIGIHGSPRNDLSIRRKSCNTVVVLELPSDAEQHALVVQSAAGPVLVSAQQVVRDIPLT